MKFLVEHPLDVRPSKAVVVCSCRFDELKDNFPAPPEAIDSIFGLRVEIDDNVPLNEIRLVSWVRYRGMKDYVTRVDRVIHVI